MKNENSYQKLSDHLDRLPDGFGATDPDAALRLLKRLFTPEEAELAVHLTLDREEAQDIARKAGLTPAEAKKRLAEMARKGLIFCVYPNDGPPVYQAVPFAFGIYEFQVNRLNEDFVKDLTEYLKTKKPQPLKPSIPQSRTIPIGASIAPNLEALPYEKADELINGQHGIAVAPCICRRFTAMRGKGCNGPEETCLMFGEWAEFYIRNGNARSVERNEVREILARADAANLVLQPNNSREMVFLCCCCGCCCGILKGLRRHPKPSAIVSSPFIAQLDRKLCRECGICLKRCQMQALSATDGRIALDIDRCIGCGLCVTTCPSGALTLKRKPGRGTIPLPADLNATWRAIVRAKTASRSDEK